MSATDRVMIAGTVFVALVGCSGGSDRAVTVPAPSDPQTSVVSTWGASSSPSPSASLSPAQPVGAAKLKGALLTMAEIPTGFSMSDESGDSSETAPGGSACSKRYDNLGKANTSSSAAKADRAFDQGRLLGASVYQALTAFRGGGEAPPRCSAQ